MHVFSDLAIPSKKKKKKKSLLGIPWWSSGQDSVLSLPRARVRSLVGELDPTSRKAQSLSPSKKSFAIKRLVNEKN